MFYFYDSVIVWHELGVALTVLQSRVESEGEQNLLGKGFKWFHSNCSNSI